MPRHLVEQYCCHNYRQHNRGSLYEGRGGGDEVRPSLCPSMRNPDLVFQETGDCSPTHSRWLNDIAHKLSRLTQLDRVDRMVPPVRVFPSNMLLVALGLIGLFFSTWLNNNCLNLHHWGQIPQYGQWYNQSAMGGSGPICLPTGSHLGQVVEKLQDYPCRGITLIAPSGPTCLVLESLGHVKSDSLVPVQPAPSTI